MCIIVFACETGLVSPPLVVSLHHLLYRLVLIYMKQVHARAPPLGPLHDCVAFVTSSHVSYMMKHAQHLSVDGRWGACYPRHHFPGPEATHGPRRCHKTLQLLPARPVLPHQCWTTALTAAAIAAVAAGAA